MQTQQPVVYILIHQTSALVFVSHSPYPCIPCKMPQAKHMAYSTGTYGGNGGQGSLSLIWWHSFPLHTLFIVSMIFLSCRNGASYTFRVFLKRYTHQLLARHPSIQDVTRSR